MRRREFITLLGGAAASPLAARAEQVAAVPLVAFISNIPPESYGRLMSVFSQGLKETGFAEGQNVAFDYRWTNNEDDLPALGAAIVARKPAMVVGVGGTASALALKNATTTIPIVFVIGGLAGFPRCKNGRGWPTSSDIAAQANFRFQGNCGGDEHTP